MLIFKKTNMLLPIFPEYDFDYGNGETLYIDPNRKSYPPNWEITGFRTSPWWKIFSDYVYWGEDFSGKYKPDKKENLKEGIDYAIPAPKLFLDWKDRGLVKSYRITNSSAFAMDVCDDCRAEQGIHRLDDRSILPPFHPNCRCMMTLLWESDEAKNEGLKDVYDPYSGKILDALCTEKVIVDMLNEYLALECGLTKKINWGDVIEIGFWNGKPESGVESISDFDPSEHVGWETTLCVNTCQNIDAGSQGNPENTLDYWFDTSWEEAVKIKNTDIYIPPKTNSNNPLDILWNEAERNWSYGTQVGAQAIGAINPLNHTVLDEYIWLVRPGGDYDLKNRKDLIFGEGGADNRKYYAFVYKGELLEYDVLGNLLAGNFAYRLDISLESALDGANKVSFATNSESDDAKDQADITRGYNYAKTGVWK